MKKINFLPFVFLLIVFISCNNLKANIIHIPADFSTIKQGVNSASTGDTILVASRTYFENLILINKNIVLASWFLTTNDTNYINQTIVDGSGQSNILQITGSVDTSTSIVGFTFQNANDGIFPSAPFKVLHNKFIDITKYRRRQLHV